MEKEKTQILCIHGGTTFKNQEDYLNYLRNRTIYLEEFEKWNKNYLKSKLEDSCFIINPIMPLKENAKYEDWKINFENHFDQLKDNLILIGTSLGGIFLAKYLSENKFPKQINSVYLIAPPYDDTLPGEDLVGGFELGEDLSLIEENCSNLTLMFSKDDLVVPISHADKYKSKLKDAKFEIYESKNGHFLISEFPEIVDMIKSDLDNLE